MTNEEQQILRHMLGDRATGETVYEQAKTSDVLFVRSQDHLSLYKNTGRVMTALEVLMYLGYKHIIDVYTYGASILPKNEYEPARTLKNKRESLFLSIEDLSRLSKVKVKDILDAEDHTTRTPMSIIVALCNFLGLEWRNIGV